MKMIFTVVWVSSYFHQQQIGIQEKVLHIQWFCTFNRILQKKSYLHRQFLYWKIDLKFVVAVYGHVWVIKQETIMNKEIACIYNF